MITVDIEERIDAYDAALQRGESPAELLQEYLPAADEPEYFPTLVELLRIALEHEWKSGAAGVEQYRASFPALFADQRRLEPLVFEEYRLRCAGGELVSREDYARRYHVDISNWPELTPAALSTAPETPISDDDWLDYSRSEPASAMRALVGRKMLPQAGETFGSFRLLAVLGEGAFGRVFLARQQLLAERLVALKITFGKPTEAQKLARLQHGNIMPVYSVHCRGKLSGLCMPFLGSATLADVIGSFRRTGDSQPSAESLVRTLEERRAAISTFVEGESAPAADSPQAVLPRPALPDGVPSHQATGAASLEISLARIMRQVADGLAQAHDRGILHRDIKPANILIAADGQPLLLDFNLAAEQSGHVARIGGTLPYMSPEQLSQFQGTNVQLDGRSDLYSLGVVMYEALTGRHPFVVRRGSLDAIVQQMRADRQTSPPDVRTVNKSISPALAAIVAGCLQADPNRRYQNAHQLRDDLQLHLQDYPLRHKRNPSYTELTAKWCRRHPRLTSISTVLAVVCCLAAAAGLLWYSREEKLAHKEANEKFRQADEALLNARSLLLIGGRGSNLEADGVRSAVGGLQQYSVLSNPTWFDSADVQRLPSQHQVQLRRDVAEILLLLALHARTDSPNEVGDLPNAMTLKALALKSAGAAIENEAESLLALASGSAGQSWNSAEKQLREITVQRPRDAFAWLALAQLCRVQGRLGEAEVAANAAVALRADLELPWLMRGLVYQLQKRWSEAEEDFTRAIGLGGENPTAWFNRGVCRQELQHHREASADFTAAIDKGFTETRVYFSRARSLRAAGDADLAEADLKLGKSLQPRDVLSYIARALANLPDDAAAAEVDLNAAQKLEPASRIVLMNLAHVRSEHLGKTEQALEVLAQIKQLYPRDTDALGSRAVLFARLQNREAAVAELKELLKVEVRPPLAIYQSACVYALLSKDQPALRAQALQLLATSLAIQPGLINTARTDADLSNLREEPLYQQLFPRPKQNTRPE